MNHIQIIKDIFEIYNKHYVSYGDYSVTTLLSSPRVIQLFRRYGHQVSPDIQSQVGSFIGTATHKLIEECLRMRYQNDNTVQLEKTIAWPFTLDNKTRIVSGKFDVLYTDSGIHLHDNKVVNVWAKVYDPDMKEWHSQQNFYAFLLHLRGVDVNSINIDAWYKDWVEIKSVRDRKYPQSQIEEYQLSLWPWEQTEELLIERLAMHINAEETPDNQLPLCTKDEMWEQKPVYAVMKNKNAQKSSGNYDTYEEALEGARSKKGMTAASFIEVRPGARKRCDRYCSVRDYCSQYVEYAKRQRGKLKNENIPLEGVLF